MAIAASPDSATIGNEHTKNASHASAFENSRGDENSNGSKNATLAKDGKNAAISVSHRPVMLDTTTSASVHASPSGASILIRICHLSIGEMGFLHSFPLRDDTIGSSHGSSCQSPRSQRKRRRSQPANDDGVESSAVSSQFFAPEYAPSIKS